MTEATKALFSLANLRREATRGGRAIDGGAAFSTVRDDVLLALVESVEAAQEVCNRLDAALRWNYERGRAEAVKEIQFAIGATLSMREPLERFERAE